MNPEPQRTDFDMNATACAPVGATTSLLAHDWIDAADLWLSDSMEPTIEFGDAIAVTPTAGIEADGLYMLHYRSGSIKGPVRHLAADVVRVIRRVRRLDDGRLHLSYDGVGYQCDEVVTDADLARWCTIAGKVNVARRNGRAFSC